MSVGPLGFLGSLAAAPSQSKGSEIDRARTEAASRNREAQAQEHAQEAEGIGHTEEEQQAGDRDADGRRLWERTDAKKKSAGVDQQEASDHDSQSKDATGDSGKQLDLSG